MFKPRSHWACDLLATKVTSPQAMLVEGLGSLGEEKQNLCLQTITTSERSSREGVFRKNFHFCKTVQQQAKHALSSLSVYSFSLASS